MFSRREPTPEEIVLDLQEQAYVAGIRSLEGMAGKLASYQTLDNDPDLLQGNQTAIRELKQTIVQLENSIDEIEQARREINGGGRA